MVGERSDREGVDAVPSKLASQEKAPLPWYKRRTVYGWAITAVWLTVWPVTTLWCVDAGALCVMNANEWGDWAAGTFAPLAFLWLVLGYMQQGQELAQNTQALERQESALKNQVKETEALVQAQHQLVEVSRLQAESTARANNVAAIATMLARQPRFVVHTSKGGAQNGHMLFEIVNDGAPINKVHLRRMKDIVELQPKSIARWEHGAAQNVIVRFTVAPRFKARITIFYMDGMGLKQVLRVVLRATKEGTLHFEPQSFQPRLPKVDEGALTDAQVREASREFE